MANPKQIRSSAAGRSASPKPLQSSAVKRSGIQLDEAPATPEQLHELVRRAARPIVTANIEQAQAGSYLHAKFLFEFAGLQAILPEAADAEEESLAQMLLRELESGERDASAA